MVFGEATMVTGAEVAATITTTRLPHTLQEHQSQSHMAQHDPAARALLPADSKTSRGDLASGLERRLEQRQAMQQVLMPTFKIGITRGRELPIGLGAPTHRLTTSDQHPEATTVVVVGAVDRALLDHRAVAMRVLDLAGPDDDRHFSASK